MPLDGEQRGFIVEEVQRQIAPVAATVARMDRTLRSLYSNGSGGPPGYLETARAEDKARISELLDMKREDHERLKVVESKIAAQDTAAQTIAGVKVTSDKVESKAAVKLANRIAIAAVIIGLLSLLGLGFSVYTAWHESQRKLGTENSPPAVQSLQQPQNAGGEGSHHW